MDYGFKVVCPKDGVEYTAHGDVQFIEAFSKRQAAGGLIRDCSGCHDNCLVNCSAVRDAFTSVVKELNARA